MLLGLDIFTNGIVSLFRGKPSSESLIAVSCLVSAADAMTQGRGSFTLEFIRYNEAPGAVQQKIIEEAKALAAAEE